MNDTDKRKTLYDEIFNESSAPEVTNNNGVKEIKDAIDNKKFNENDMVAPMYEYADDIIKPHL